MMQCTILCTVVVGKRQEYFFPGGAKKKHHCCCVCNYGHDRTSSDMEDWVHGTERNGNMGN